MPDRIEKLQASLAARYRAGPLPGFFAWWSGELAGLLPAGLRRRLVAPRPALMLVPEADGGSLTVWRTGEKPEQLDHFSAEDNPRLLRDRWLERAGGFEDGSPEIRLCLPPADVLQCPVELPLAVESNLDGALRYQLDQLTPFSADQVFYDYHVVRRDSEHGRLHLALRLAPAERVDALRERLRNIGIRPHVIDTLAADSETPAGEGFNLLPERERPRYVHRRARLNWVLAASAAVVLALVMWHSLHLRESSAERLRAGVAELRTEAEEVMALQQSLNDAEEAANFLAEHRAGRPVVIEVIDEITRILPEDMWLRQFRINGNELRIQGLADGSQRLIDLVNDSELLTDAEFRGSIQIDPASGRDRFNARATILTPRTGDATVAESGQ